MPTTLPSDIQRVVFEIVAWEDRAKALQLVTLARHVQQWIEPIIYRSIDLPTEERAELFLISLNSKRFKSPDFFQNNVKALTLDLDRHREDERKLFTKTLPSIISGCSGVSSLIISPDADIQQPIPDLIPTARLDRFACNAGAFDLPRRGLDSPVFQDLTFLHLLIRGTELDSWKWETLRQLTSLLYFRIDPLHIEFNVFFTPPTIQPVNIGRWHDLICKHLPSTVRVWLLWLVLCQCEDLSSDWIILLSDPRLVIITDRTVGMEDRVLPYILQPSTDSDMDTEWCTVPASAGEKQTIWEMGSDIVALKLASRSA